MELFPENKQSHFTVKMSPRSDLCGKWAISLSEVIIPRNWFNISNHNNDYTITRHKIRREKITDVTCEIPLTTGDENEGTLFHWINKNIVSLTGSKLAEFVLDKDYKNVKLNLEEGFELRISREKAHKLLYFLNLPTKDIVFKQRSSSLILRDESEEYLSNPRFYKDQFITLIERDKKVVEEIDVEEKIFIPIGLYSSVEKFLGIFKYIKLALLPNNKIVLKVHKNITIEFGNELKDLLGFKKSKFSEGEYVSDYPIELSAGISEIFIYSNIVASHRVGDITAPLLRVIPVMGEKSDQIVRVYQSPLYLPLRRNYIDTIEIELRTASGKEIVFFGGKTLLVLSFKQI
ncbi:uncharacterized protein LOC111638645 [Centruroides sculpturatus]|uniref:uncharacterized protein LOC111638645 n=1 Tax=Centruroides sculpturatus TaxID=218467 RepID=UPI000C6E31D0|nr:uncharacterized protein LOC111638645 [Centruroides sculpturatus]